MILESTGLERTITDPEYPTRPVKVLHVVTAMHRGGIETWLVDALRHTNRNVCKADVLTHAAQEASLDESVRATGARLIHGPSTKWPWNYERHFRNIMREFGPYDVVQVHMHHFGGIVLRSAAHAGVPVRIALSHSDTRGIDSRAHAARKLYLRVAANWIQHYSTRRLAVSGLAAACLFGDSWQSDPGASLLCTGVDLDKFRISGRSRAGLRKQLRLPEQASVFGHIGRIAPPKNHRFLIEIFRRIARLKPDAQFVLVGDGPLRAEIEERVKEAGIADQTKFLGMRNDVPQLLAGVIDTLIFPSLWEGLPVTLIESQAAGVPALSSDAVTDESVESPELVRRLSLNCPAEEWAHEAIALSAMPRSRHGLKLDGSRFDVRSCVRRMQDIYLQELREGLES